MDLFRRLFTQPTNRAGDEDGTSSTSARETAKTVEGAKNNVITEGASPASTAELPAVMLDGGTRPLAPESVISSSNQHLTFGQATDVGMMRSNNQDAVFSFVSTGRSVEQRPDFGLFIVADGMGGHHDGEKAAATTANIVAAYVMENIFLPMLKSQGDVEQVPITEALNAAVQKANDEIISKVPDGGTTLTAVALVGDLAYVVHVGDTRVYLATKESLEQITRDHSLVQRLIELGQLTHEEAALHAQRNVLYRALGQSEHLEVDAITRRLPPNSRLLICSDGLWNMVPDSEILATLHNSSGPQDACEKLVAQANLHGGTDNITVVTLHIPHL